MLIQKKITKIKLEYWQKNRRMSHNTEMFKFIPFLMDNFVDFVEDNKFEAETFYLKKTLQKKSDSERYYTINDLIFIFNSSQLYNLRLLWKLFLRKSIAQIIIENIQSKKMRIVYQSKVNHYILLFNLKDTYNYQNDGKIQTDFQTQKNDYPLCSSKFQLQIKQLLSNYIEEDKSNTMKDPNNFLAIIDIINYLHNIEEFYIEVNFSGQQRRTSIRINNIKQYINGKKQIEQQRQSD